MVEDFGLSAPKTRDLLGVLKTLGCAESCLIVDADPGRELLLSARNLPRVKVSAARNLNAYDVLFHRKMVLTRQGFEALKEMHGDG